MKGSYENLHSQERPGSAGHASDCCAAFKRLQLQGESGTDIGTDRNTDRASDKLSKYQTVADGRACNGGNHGGDNRRGDHRRTHRGDYGERNICSGGYQNRGGNRLGDHICKCA